MKWLLSLALMLSVSFSGCSGASTKPDDSLILIKQAEVLRVAIDPSYPPFSFTDNKGAVVGYDVDLAREIASRLGVSVTFIAMDIGSILDSLVARKADAAISAISPSWEYSKEVGFSRRYFNAGQVLVVRRGASETIHSGELEMATLGVEVGSAGEVEGRRLAHERPGVTLVPFNSVEAGLTSLASKEIEVLITDRVTAATLLKWHKSLRIAGDAFTNEPYAVAVRSTDQALLKEIDVILEALSDNGFLTSLEKKWIESDS